MEMPSFRAVLREESPGDSCATRCWRCLASTLGMTLLRIRQTFSKPVNTSLSSQYYQRTGNERERARLRDEQLEIRIAGQRVANDQRRVVDALADKRRGELGEQVGRFGVSQRRDVRRTRSRRGVAARDAISSPRAASVSSLDLRLNRRQRR